METKVIIFDIGGVIINETNDKIFESMESFTGISKSLLINEKNDERSKVSSGESNLLKMYEKIVKKFGISKSPRELLSKHLALYKEYALPRKNVIELIRELKKSYKIVCLTNTEREIADYNKGKGLFKIFDKSYISCYTGLIKPEKGAYIKILKDLKITPEEALFIDDRKEYVEEAKILGIKTILGINSEQIGRELKKLFLKKAIRL